MRFYHVTLKRWLPAIRKRGVVPGPDGVTYLWDSLEWAADFAAGACPGKSKVVLVVEVDRQSTRVDECYSPGEVAHGHAFVLAAVIPPSKILRVLTITVGLPGSVPAK